ncbi:hypothetical protein JVU11DRAFT_2611 [Chiua virens]|nr:hypothetical protein JVU11DRAFT_2611 [Chiua virens]
MLTVGDGTSAALSASWATASANELPDIPTNEWRVLPSKSGVGGPRKMAQSNFALAFKHAGEPLSIDPVPSPGRTSTLYRQSAKQLIYRFESMTDEAQLAQVKRPSSVRASSEIDSRDMHRPFLTVASHKSKRRSLSNSLRNLMSVFKKKKDKDKESDDDDFIPPLYAPELNFPIPLEPAPLPIPHIVQQPSGREIPLSSSSTSPVLSSNLLYLSRPSSQSPGWMSCVVALYHSHLLITWYTMHDSPSTHTVQLAGFMDVRSLNERVVRPDAEGDLKTFELSFEGRPRETFAATSTQERARWVGAIWDAVLSLQHRSEPVHTPKPIETLTIRTDITPEQKPLSSPGEASSEYTSSSAPKTPSAHETPPPTPVPKSPRRTLSPLSLSPPRPPSQLSSPHSRSKSPSMANLGTLSVVTQRLAQIERSEVNSPASSTTTSSSVGTALRRAQTTHATDQAHQGRPFSEIERLQKENVRRGVETPSTDAPIVIPLPNPPNVPPSEAASVRSAFRRHRASPSVPTPPSSPAKALASVEVSVPTLRAKLSEPAIREHVENPPTTLSAAGVTSQLAPLAELIKDTAAKHYDQTAGLGEQIISLQRDIHILPKEMQESLKQAVVTAVKRASDSNSHRDNASLENVSTSLEGLRKQVLANTGDPRMESLMKVFTGLQGQLATLTPLLLEKLASIEHGQTQLQLQAAREAERPSAPTEDSLREGSHQTSVDLSDLHSKLDELASLYKSSIAMTSAEKETLSSQSSNVGSEKLQAILDHLTLDEEQRKLLLDQQTDSVRYLNELNSWLETFVNGGTTHIQSVAANVEQLCSHLGIPAESDTAASDGQPSGQGMLGEIRHLISSVETKALGENQLQASVGELMNAVREQLKTGTENRTALVTDSVLEIINRQRYEQEQMLRALSTELTNEIRGERLRFVEAMKEATAINVQAHVEHFKSELNKEVAAMTQDVGRLHQEKQAIEQQIADLFSFYSKQKQEAENNARRNAPPRSAGFSNLQNLPSPTPKRPRRPLPHPVFQRKD